jgi:hypothetical protein
MARAKLTEELLQQRIEDYCARHGAERNAEGFPVFPTGRRETPQHREWIVLFKARSRLRKAAGSAPEGVDRGALIARQRGRCPVCDAEVRVDDAYDDRGVNGPALVHRACAALLTRVASLGPEGLERLRSYLWARAGRR